MPRFRAGDTIHWHYPDNCDQDHLSIVLCDSDYEPETVILVPISTLNSKSDTTVVLNVGDHPFIRHPSSVVYRLTESIYTDDIDIRGFTRDAKLREDILEKVIDGVFKSDDTEYRMIKALKNRLQR